MGIAELFPGAIAIIHKNDRGRKIGALAKISFGRWNQFKFEYSSGNKSVCSWSRWSYKQWITFGEEAGFQYFTMNRSSDDQGSSEHAWKLADDDALLLHGDNAGNSKIMWGLRNKLKQKIYLSESIKFELDCNFTKTQEERKRKRNFKHSSETYLKKDHQGKQKTEIFDERAMCTTKCTFNCNLN